MDGDEPDEDEDEDEKQQPMITFRFVENVCVLYNTYDVDMK